MKILLLTQIVDKNDTFLGFTHTWLESFATRFENIIVVCLKEGVHDLPDNVQVYSLGKEGGVSRCKYVKNFFKNIWKHRKEYESVFVKMNHEYVVLGGWLWRLMGKKVTLWRNHFEGSALVDIAALFCHKVFCTSKYSYTAKYKKAVFMPVGVPEDVFNEVDESRREPHSILSFVRISPAKKIEQLIEALSLLKKKGVQFTATICGDATPELKEYEEMLHKKVKDSDLESDVTFKKGIPYAEVPELYASHEMSVNQSPSGMYDKTIFEAMLSGTLVLSCNKNLESEIDEMFLFTEDNIEELADRLEHLLLLSEQEREERKQELQEYALKNHSLKQLTKRLIEEFKI